MAATGRRPGETFLPLDVDFADDEKVARLARYGSQARSVRDLLVQMWCHCKAQTTDGHVPSEVVGKLAYPDSVRIATRDADRLVECGIAERTPTGYYLPGYLKRNKSRAQLEADREHLAETGSESGSWGNHVRWHVKGAKPSPTCEHCARDRVRLGSGSGNPEPDSIGSDRTETETETENRDKGITTEGGQRTETLAATDATKPPQDPTRCKDHQTTDSPPPCRGCKTAREAHERDSKRHLVVVADCETCGGSGWIEDADGNPIRRCKHRTAK